jgi:hypothetical protein
MGSNPFRATNLKDTMHKVKPNWNEDIESLSIRTNDLSKFYPDDIDNFLRQQIAYIVVKAFESEDYKEQIYKYIETGGTSRYR